MMTRSNIPYPPPPPPSLFVLAVRHAELIKATNRPPSRTPTLTMTFNPLSLPLHLGVGVGLLLGVEGGLLSGEGVLSPQQFDR